MSSTAASTRQRPLRTRRRLLPKLVLLALGLVLGALVGEIGLRFLTVKDASGRESIGRTLLAPVPVPSEEASRAIWEADATYMVPDERLGWSLRPNGQDQKLGLYAANSLGLRSLPREAALTPAPGSVRVLAVGDSFTHCDQVSYEESWTHLLEQRLPAGFEVLNGGVPGYGTDQALLRWRDLGPKLKPKLAIFGFILEDAMRNVNIVRTLEYVATSFPFTKPRFVLEGGDLRLINSPVVPPQDIAAILRRFGAHPLRPYEHWYVPGRYETHWLDGSRLARYCRSKLLDRQATALRRQVLAPGSEALRLTARTARAFCDEARMQGVIPLVLLIPSVKDLAALQSGARPWDSLREELKGAGVDDLFELPEPLLREAAGLDVRSFYVDGQGHLSGAGNAAVARLLAPEIQRRLQASAR